MGIIEHLGDLLRAAGFGGQRAHDLVGEDRIAPPYDALTVLGRPDDARLAVLVRLFRDGHAIGLPLAERVLTPLAIDDLVRALVLDVDGSRVRARLQLTGFDDLILAGDPNREHRSAAFVAPVTLASRYVARLTVRREVTTALDMGTGSGVHALLAARHVDRVVGVDINADALSKARVSQQLSRVDDRVEWTEGSWVDAVRAERFDLVVSNPPWVISPDNQMLYRDGETGGDDVSRQVVRSCAAALTEGGFATVMCSWVHQEGDWEGPVREWVHGLACDALVLHSASNDPLVYALSWNQDLVGGDQAQFAEIVTRWVAHYQRTGAARIATGFILLRRRSAGPNWVRTFENVGAPLGQGGEHLERMFSAGDFVEASAGAGQLQALLARPWSLLNGHRLNQGAIFEDGAYEGEGYMRPHPDMGIRAKIDPRVLSFILGCDGQRPLGDLLAESAVPDGMDRGAFHSLCLGTARDMIARGLLV